MSGFAQVLQSDGLIVGIPLLPCLLRLCVYTNACYSFETIPSAHRTLQGFLSGTTGAADLTITIPNFLVFVFCTQDISLSNRSTASSQELSTHTLPPSAPQASGGECQLPQRRPFQPGTQLRCLSGLLGLDQFLRLPSFHGLDT